MISHKQISKGGEFTVHDTAGDTVVEYTISNSIGSVLCLRSCVMTGNVKYATNIISSLIEKYTPSVLVLQSSLREVLYQRRMGTMNKIETKNKTSLYAQSAEDINLLASLWKTGIMMESSEDCGNTTMVLKKIRENTKPFEFLSIKEEYDYLCRGSCNRAMDDILKISRCSIDDKSFDVVIKSLKNKMSQDAKFYESNIGGILQCVEEIIIPAIIRLGETHPFPNKLIESFGESVGKYFHIREEFAMRFNFEK